MIAIVSRSIFVILELRANYEKLESIFTTHYSTEVDENLSLLIDKSADEPVAESDSSLLEFMHRLS